MRRTKKDSAVWRLEREKKERAAAQRKQSARKEADLLDWDPPPGVHMAAAP